MTVYLKPEKDKGLRELLLEKKINIQSPCGGNGKCGKCKVKLIKGDTIPLADSEGFVYACHTKLLSPCVFYIPDFENDVYFNHNFSDKEPIYAICDVGTTNVKVTLYSKEFKVCSSKTFKNPQFPFGADVVSRISASKNGGYKELSAILREGISRHLNGIETAFVFGNPTMIHFMAGVDPSPIGVYPYECVFNEIKYLKKNETDLPFDMVLLPSASGFVGSDSICGIYKALSLNNKISLIADLGTNGEISLIKNGEIFSATTAAGPAIEGAGIEMGLCGGDGVIYQIDIEGTPKFMGDKAKGINGGGLISLISYLLRNKKISSNGRLNENRYYLTDEVYVSQKDISEFMIAKSAVRTAIDFLLKETETSFDDVEVLYLTGGICVDLAVEDLAQTGIIPNELKNKSVYVFNLAESGAFSACFENKLHEIEQISRKIKTLSLTDNDEFEEAFVLNTFFEE